MRRYLFHLLLGLPCAAFFAGVTAAALESVSKQTVGVTLFVVIGGIFGAWLNSWKRTRWALFVWIPPLALFFLAWHGLDLAWNPSWAKVSRDEYVWNNLFGNCAETECISAMTPVGLAASIVYSAGALASYARSRRRDARIT